MWKREKEKEKGREREISTDSKREREGGIDKHTDRLTYFFMNYLHACESNSQGRERGKPDSVIRVVTSVPSHSSRRKTGTKHRDPEAPKPKSRICVCVCVRALEKGAGNFCCHLLVWKALSSQ